MKIYEYVIRLKDQASDKLKRLAGSTSATDRNVNRLDGSFNKATANGNMFGSMGSMVARFIGPAVLGAALISTTLKASSLAREFEQTRISFEVMIGSVKNGRSLLDETITMANKTPFTSADIQGNAKTLLGFGVAARKVIPTLKMLGDISGGNADRFRLLSLAYAQTQAAGRLMGQDLLQMVNSGFNPLQIISEKTGKSIGELKKAMENGAISAKMVEAAFKAATSEGGKFFGMMDRQSETFEGRMSTMKDKWGIWLTQIGSKINEKLAPYLDKAIEIIDRLIDPTGAVYSQADKEKDSFNKLYTSMMPAITRYNQLIELKKSGAKVDKELFQLQSKIGNAIPLSVTDRNGTNIKAIDIAKATEVLNLQDRNFQDSNKNAIALALQQKQLAKDKLSQLSAESILLAKDHEVKLDYMQQLQEKYTEGTWAQNPLNALKSDNPFKDDHQGDHVSTKLKEALKKGDRNSILAVYNQEMETLNQQVSKLDSQLSKMRTDTVGVYLTQKTTEDKNAFKLGDGKGKEEQDGLDKITKGGKQAINVTINLESLLQNSGDVNVTNVQESVADMEKILIEGLLRVVNSGNQAANQ
ncbi:MAG: tape measure protein [Shewanella sp.]